MDIFWTVLIIIGTIIGAVVSGPFIMFGFIALLGGAVFGLVFSIVVVLLGVELTGGVMLTCFIAGVILAGCVGVFTIQEKSRENATAQD